MEAAAAANVYQERCVGVTAYGLTAMMGVGAHSTTNYTTVTGCADYLPGRTPPLGFLENVPTHTEHIPFTTTI